jgi:2-keto-4-pentenoate hydratase
MSGALTMKAEDARLLAVELATAQHTLTPISPISDRVMNFTPDDAYQVQLAHLSERELAGRRQKGHKIGLTSRAMQEQLQIESPDYGYLLDDMFWSSGDELAFAFIQPRIEPEIAVILGEDIADPRASRERVASAVRGVAPALEIIDSRIADWRIKLVDTIADNASSAAVILGPESPWTGELDLRSVRCHFYLNDELVGTGDGSAVMGDPLEAVGWLARLLIAKGRQLRAGEIVIPGALTGAVAIEQGDTVRATFEGIGSVWCAFAQGIAVNDG